MFGGHSNWKDVIDSLLFFFSMDAKLQREHLIAANRIHFKLYKKNIDVLCDNHPFLMSLVLGDFNLYLLTKR